MAFPTLDGQVVPVAGQITSPVLTGAANKTPVGHNASNSGGRAYAPISATTNAILNGAGRLCRIHCVGTGGTIGAITAYDSLTGAGTVIFGPTTPTAGQIFDLQIPVGTGISVVLAAATTILVTWETY